MHSKFAYICKASNIEFNCSLLPFRWVETSTSEAENELRTLPAYPSRPEAGNESRTLLAHSSSGHQKLWKQKHFKAPPKTSAAKIRFWKRKLFSTIPSPIIWPLLVSRTFIYGAKLKWHLLIFVFLDPLHSLSLSHSYNLSVQQRPVINCRFCLWKIVRIRGLCD